MTTPILSLTNLFLSQDAVILNVQGRLTAENLDDFHQSSDQVLTLAGNVIVNLENATFLDSAALGSLVGLAKEARRAGGDVWLANVPAGIFTTLRLLRLDSFFPIQPDLPSCLAAIRKHSGRRVAVVQNER